MDDTSDRLPHTDSQCVAANARALLADYYRLHCNDLRAFVVRLVGRSDVSEDIVQNVFLRLLRSSMITPVTLPSLVYTVARNMAYDYWRHRRAVEEFEHVVRSRYNPESGEPTTEIVYSVTEISELLERGIARLTEQQQQVYVMSVYEGMKVSEISETLHMNYKSVENRLGTARKQVRSYIKTRLAI